MKKYEAMFIFKPDLTNENLEKTITQVKDAIAKDKGSLSEAKEWGKQRLSFPIKKYQEGSYYLVNFDSDPKAITKLKRTFSLNESILRVLITKA